MEKLPDPPPMPPDYYAEPVNLPFDKGRLKPVVEIRPQRVAWPTTGFGTASTP